MRVAAGIPEQRFLTEERDFVIGGGRSLSLLLQILAPPGLIVIPELTRSAMENAIAQLWKQGYFDRSSR